MNTPLQTSEIPGGGQLLAVLNFYCNYAVMTLGCLFKFIKNRYTQTRLNEVNAALQQINLNGPFIGFDITTAAAPDTWSKIEQAVNNLNLCETIRYKKSARLFSYAEFNTNKAYNNKHQYIAVHAGTTIITRVESLADTRKK